MTTAVDLPLLFSGLQRMGSWSNVDVNVMGLPKNGRYRIDSNGPFLFFAPSTANSHPFVLFLGNYTPVPDHRRGGILLQQLQFTRVTQTLNFPTPEVQTNFLRFVFESLQQLEQLTNTVDLADFCLTSQLVGVVPGQSKPVSIIAIMQEGGFSSSVQFHIIQKSQAKPGINFQVSKSTHISPALELPKQYAKEKPGILRRLFLMCEVERQRDTDCWVLCKNEHEMMSWILSVYLAMVISHKRKVQEALRKSRPSNVDAPAVEIAIRDIPIEEPKDDLVLTAPGVLDDAAADPMSRSRPKCCPFVDDVKSAGNDRKLVLACLLLRNGMRDDAKFVASLKQLNVVDPRQFNEVVRMTQAVASDRQISFFVSTAVARGLFGKVLEAIGSSERWQADFYLLGALVRFPKLVTDLCPLYAAVSADGSSETLLDELSYSDERRYIKNLPFEYLRLARVKRRLNFPTIIYHLENGMLFEYLFLTKGPWALISECEKTGKMSGPFVAAFREVSGLSVVDPKRLFPSRLEDFLHRGIRDKRLADWIMEINACREVLEGLYEPDATICDPGRAALLAESVRAD
jgi:hypothetical protein